MTYKPLVYVAHPCGSGLNKNRKKCRRIISLLTKELGDKYIFISPVLNYGHMYFDVDYICGIETCIDLLKRCNMLLLAGEWKGSKGCLCEYGAARAMGMPVSELAGYFSSKYLSALNSVNVRCLHPGIHGQRFETISAKRPDLYPEELSEEYKESGAEEP